MTLSTRDACSRVLRLLLAILTLLAAAALIWQCADIYRVGTVPENLTQSGVRIHDIYSNQIVSERFERIAWVVWLWLAALIAAVIFRAPAARSKGVISVESRYFLAVSRVDKNAQMLKEERKRRGMQIICLAACAFCVGFILRYLLAPTSFDSRDLEDVIGRLMCNTAPWAVLILAILMAEAVLREKSLLREIALAKTAPKLEQQKANMKKPMSIAAARIILAALSILLITAGVFNGGMRDVLVKAVNICTECIGLG